MTISQLFLTILPLLSFSLTYSQNTTKMKEIKTEIIIDASSEQVWQVLTDYESYPDWNPFIISIEGEKEVGGRLKNTMLNDGKTSVFKPVIQKWEENQHFEWLGSLPLRLFTGRHYFILEPINANQTKLIHGEYFGGLLRGLIMKQIGEATLQSFLAMNRALKQRVESKVEIGK